MTFETFPTLTDPFSLLYAYTAYRHVYVDCYYLNTTMHTIIPSRIISFLNRYGKILWILTTAFKTGWLRSYCQQKAWLCTRSTALFPLWLLKKHLGLPTSRQMEEQPHTHSGLQAPLCGAKHNNNPRGRSALVRCSAFNESAMLNPRFSMVTANETSVQHCSTHCEFTEDD